MGVEGAEDTLFHLITAPALITAPPDFLLYFHLLSPTWRSYSWLFTLFSLIIAHLTILFLTFYFIFTYYRPLDDLLALIVENKFT